jgi:pilus assembly protein CpaE
MLLLLSPEPSFVPYLQQVVGPTVEIDHRWDPAWLSQPPIEVVHATIGRDPYLVLIGPTVPEAHALEWAGAFDRERPDIGRVLVMPPTQELLMGAMRLGVREIVPPTAPAAQLREAIDRVLAVSTRLRSARPEQAPAPAGGLTPVSRVITVLSAKGGTGKTVVATNLALGLNMRFPGRVVLVDLDVQFGDCASALNVEPEHTLTDAALSAGNLDATALKLFLTPHPSGLFLLCPPVSLVDASEISGHQVKAILDQMINIFEYVIIDTSSGIDDHAITAMEFSTDLVLVCTSEVPSVRAMRRQVETLDTIGINHPKRHFVINRAATRVGLRSGDIEQMVGLPASVEMPSSRQVVMSTNQGNPILVSANRDPAARAMQELIDLFAVSDEAADRRGRKSKR